MELTEALLAECIEDNERHKKLILAVEESKRKYRKLACCIADAVASLVDTKFFRLDIAPITAWKTKEIKILVRILRDRDTVFEKSYFVNGDLIDEIVADLLEEHC